MLEWAGEKWREWESSSQVRLPVIAHARTCARTFNFKCCSCSPSLAIAPSAPIESARVGLRLERCVACSVGTKFVTRKLGTQQPLQPVWQWLFRVARCRMSTRPRPTLQCLIAGRDRLTVSCSKKTRGTMKPRPRHSNLGGRRVSLATCHCNGSRGVDSGLAVDLKSWNKTDHRHWAAADICDRPPPLPACWRPSGTC